MRVNLIKVICKYTNDLIIFAFTEQILLSVAIWMAIRESNFRKVTWLF